MTNKLKKIIRDKLLMTISLIGAVFVIGIIATGVVTARKNDLKKPQQLVPIVKETQNDETNKENEIAKEQTTNPVKKDTGKKETQSQVNDKKKNDENNDVKIPVISKEIKKMELNFSKEDEIGWPVMGNVIQMFSMDTTVWFPTLAQYKVSPGIEISCEKGTYVACVANSKVVKIGRNEELGNFVEMDMGNGFHAIYAQLCDIEVTEGSEVAGGRIFARVSEPTRYYSLDGAHLYFELRENNTPIDPLDYIR